MRIAVPYENGNIFQHFGKTESFKLYNAEGGKILSSQTIYTNGTGHEALAGFLGSYGVNILVCGGIGDGAVKALAAAGIIVCSGAMGDADAAVEAYIAGTLESAGVNCDHHHEEGECHCHDTHEDSCGCGDDSCGCGDDSCGCGDDCGCGGGCGGCGGGCHTPLFEGPNVGKTVRTHYRGTFNDGTEFDSSYNRGEPLEFICGMGMMIRGYDEAVAHMEVGQTVEIHLTPDQAYGYPDPRAIFTIDYKQLPGSEALEVGQKVYLSNNMGQPFPVVVTARDENTITFDANHEMAGKELNFKIELVEIL